MCEQPEHTILHRIEKKLDKIDDEVGDIRENQASLMDEVFGRENKPGLSKKVDDITSGNKKESVVVSTITAAIVGTLSVFGIQIGSN